MTTVEKIEEYLKTHKKPVTTKTLANRYLVSQSNVSQALKKLESDGVARKYRMKTPHWTHIDYFR